MSAWSSDRGGFFAGYRRTVVRAGSITVALPRGPVIAVAGPTASGKSTCAAALARDLSSAVLSVDSVSVFRGFDIGSAKPDPGERRSVPHHLIDIADPDESVDVRRFVDAAWNTIDTLTAEGKTPVLSVGTTMYFTALLHGLIEHAPRDEAFRASVSGWTGEELHAELARVDPERATQLHVNDKVRLIRALEVAHVTGQGASRLQAAHGFRRDEVKAVVVVICRDRRELYVRIDARCREMVQGGLLEEVAQLIARYGDGLQALQSIGYRQALESLQSGSQPPSSELVHIIATATRQYAKRQMTFWRNEPIKRGWMTHPTEDVSEAFVVGDEGNARSRKSSTLKGFRTFHLTYEELRSRLQDRLAAPIERTELWYIRPNGW